MQLEFKFTTMTLIAACLICVILGLIGALLIKVVCDNVCCREKNYDDQSDQETDAAGNKKYQTINFKQSSKRK